MLDRKGATVSPAIVAELNELIAAQRQSFELLGLTPPALETIHASNNWVVSGKRTATGKPLLANDPHIPASAPGIWYQTQLIAPGMHVAGVTFPGLPGIVAGHNERIAWGVTNLGPDVQDVYLEKFDKTNPTKYQTPSGLRDAEVRQEQIKVRKDFGSSATDTQTFEVTVTRHGPIILEKDGARYALRWTSLDPGSLKSIGFLEVNRARNWKEFTAALSHYRGPTQNFVYADIDGHIGYYGAGWIPIRKSGDGSVPYDGATDDGEWTGFIPFEKLPHLYDPPSGMIVTANQRVVGSSYPYFVSHVWAPPYRARRIHDLLSAKPKLTTDDFRKIQGDVHSIASKTFAQHAAKSLKSAGFQPATFVSDLESWDGMMSADSRMAVVVSQMRSAFRQRVISAALGPELAKIYGWPEADVLIDRLRHRSAARMAAERIRYLCGSLQSLVRRRAPDIDEEPGRGRIEVELGRPNKSALRTLFGGGSADRRAVHNRAISAKRIGRHSQCWLSRLDAPHCRCQRLGSRVSTVFRSDSPACRTVRTGKINWTIGATLRRARFRLPKLQSKARRNKLLC